MTDPARDASAVEHERSRDAITRGATSWVVSFLLHAGLIALLASLVWIVPGEDEPDMDLVLTDDAGSIADTAAGTADGAGGGAPGQADPASEARADARTAAPAPAPIPEDLAELVTQVTDPSPLSTTADATSGDPALAILAELAEEAAAAQPVGAGSDPMLQGTSPGFRALAGGLGETGLDVVLVIDATESMAPVIASAKRRLRDVVAVVSGIVGAARADDPDVRFGAIAFKDYGDEYGIQAVRALPLTNERDTVQAFVDDIVASGGGDLPEPIDKALAAATDKRMGWLRRRRSVIVLIGDAPCHPGGRAAALKAVSAFVDRNNAVVSVIDVSPNRGTPQGDLDAIARAGGGRAFLLEDEDLFWRSLIVSIFGEKFERDIDAILERWTKRDGS